MTIPHSVKSFLDRQGADYELLTHARTGTLSQAADAAGLPLAQLARAVVLIDGKGLLMAVLPAGHMLDFGALCAQLNRDLEPVAGDRLAAILDDCEPGSFPPLGSAFGLEEILDEELAAHEYIHFEPGNHTSLVRMRTDDFLALRAQCWRGRFSKPAEELRNAEPGGEGGDIDLRKTVEQYTPARVRRYIEDYHELPAMPATAGEVLKLYNDPRAGANDLARIVELDPSLAAQVIRYASSAYYGYKGKITNIRDAISRVLGFDMVMNLAMGIAIGKSFRIPPDGPLGLNAFWRHSVYCAALAEQLSKAMPRELRPRPGTAYLAGLLHNLGRLLLGQVFEPEFYLLNRYVAANPDISVTDIETHVLGVRHDHIGGWLMQIWDMPDEITVAVRNHHRADYWDRHALYPQLVLLANRLLKRHGIGDEDDTSLPVFTLQMLELSEEQAYAVAARVLKGGEALDTLSTQLAA